MTQMPIGPTLERARVRARSAGWQLDTTIVLALLLGSTVWATQFWNTWTAQGNQPEFYQSYFEPAVMVACGKGFVTSSPQPAALGDFLGRHRDTFDCAELPADLKLSRDALVTEAWTYLQYTVGWSWQVLGISWSGIGVLFGAFFGLVGALAYAIARLGMGRLLATMCTVAVATSSLHLANLPHLRDYSKAPFTLGLILILGVMVTTPLRRGVLVGLAATYGAVLGLGYGFRTDLLIDLPVIVVVVLLFLDGPLTRNLLVKGAAIAAFLVTFVVVSWPITSAVYEKGGCQWHVALLGLQSPFDAPLRMAPAPYDFGYAYADGFVIRGVQGFARRTQPEAPRPVYCSHAYDVQSGRYLMAIVATFPADFVARAYASMIQIVEQPFGQVAAPAKDWAAGLFIARQQLIRPLQFWGAPLTAAALLLASAASIRLGLFLLFFLAYFGGYPAVQFQERHYFHLEFMGWWALGFVLQGTAVGWAALRNGQPTSGAAVGRAAGRAAVVALTGAIVFSGLLGTARWYQQGEARRLFNAYASAPKIRLENPSAGLPGVATGDWPQYVEVELDQDACGPNPSVTFRYNPADRDGDFTRTMTVDRRASRPGPTRIFLPVFESYTGLDFSDTRPGCVLGAYQVTHLETLPLLLSATLPPEWESLPLYARVQR